MSLSTRRAIQKSYNVGLIAISKSYMINVIQSARHSCIGAIRRNLISDQRTHQAMTCLRPAPRWPSAETCCRSVDGSPQTDVGFGAHCRLKSDLARGRKALITEIVGRALLPAQPVKWCASHHLLQGAARLEVDFCAIGNSPADMKVRAEYMG